MRSIRLSVPGRVCINVGFPIIHSVHGECLRKMSDSIACGNRFPYNGADGLVSTEKTHLLSTNEKKALFLRSRRPASEEDVS